MESIAALAEAGERVRGAARVAQASDMAVGLGRYQGRPGEDGEDPFHPETAEVREQEIKKDSPGVLS